MHTLAELLSVSACMSVSVSIDLTNGKSIAALSVRFAVLVQCVSVAMSVALPVVCRLHDELVVGSVY